MKERILLIILLLVFIGGCNKDKINDFDGRYITIAIPEPNEIEQFTGPIQNYSIATLTAEDFQKIFLASDSPKGFEFIIYAKYILKENDNSTINIRITRYDDEENITENIENIFALSSNNIKNTGHKIDIVNEFNFIDYSADSVRAFYHKGWFYKEESDFFIISSIFVKEGSYVIEVSERLNPNMKSIGQENLEKIAEFILLKNNFS